MEQYWYDHLPAFRKAFLLSIFMAISCTQENRNDTKPDNINQGIRQAERPVGKIAFKDTIKIIDRPWHEILCTREMLRIKKGLGSFKTNLQADSVCWEVLGASAGITIEPVRGVGDNALVTIVRDNSTITGEILIRATPFRSKVASKTSEIRLIIENCTVPGRDNNEHKCLTQASGHGSTKDTTAINGHRRKIIAEFRELLYMYASTTSAREKEYFKTGAENKLNEIPNLSVDISSGNEIQAVFDDPAWSNPVVTPLYDLHRFFIVGVKVTQQ